MKMTLLLIVLPLSIAVSGLAQQATSTSNKATHSAPCVPRPAPKRTKRVVAPPVTSAVTPPVVPVSPEPGAGFFVGEAHVEVTKDQTVVKLAMAQHASVLIELPANDGPRYIIPGDPEMVTVDEKALERNKRAIIVRPGSLFVVPPLNQKKRMPAATVTAQMRSGLVVTFLFYPVVDLAQNVHRCVLSYQRDEVVARRRAAGLPVNLDQKEQGGEKPTGQSGGPASIPVEPAEDKQATGDSSTMASITAQLEEQPQLPVKANPLQPSTTLEGETSGAAQRAVAAAKRQLDRGATQPGIFKNWTKPLHGLALSVRQDIDLKEEFRVLLLAVRNTGSQPLKLMPGSPDLTLEMQDAKGKVINVQSIKPLHSEISEAGNELGVGGTLYYAITYIPPLMGVRHRLKIVVAQTNAADEPAAIALMK